MLLFMSEVLKTTGKIIITKALADLIMDLLDDDKAKADD